MSFSIWSWPAAAFTRLMKSGVVSSASPRDRRWALSAALRNGHGGDARDFERVLEGQEHAGRRAAVGLHLQEVLAVEQDLAVEDLVVLLAGDHVGERRLAGPVRAP
jgi:hypothetical protein